ncbi:hypothetical protein QQF64_005617 [Cirrhinus molitorella]|uniref:Uncharacterized protein n=1 Tax=Cirrhinus molitorella TaxID=172907 RepID=A0ABR3MGR7_9TELE
MVGLQLFASLWPDFNSRAYKLSLNSVELCLPTLPPPFCHCLLTNVPLQLFPDMADPTFCSSPFRGGFWPHVPLTR